jgi:hypothetical protein
MTESLKDLEEEVSNADEPAQVPPGDIVAYNELRSCADLYRMHTQKILELHPEFQREVVWKGPAQTRFVDSLIKQLPIPSMCFAMDHKAQRWIVIDGLQRISTIVKFLAGGDWTLSELDDVEPEIAGKSVAAIKTATDSLHAYYTRVENLSIPITVLRCNFDKRSHMNYLFTIFHRLNTGGVKLNNQEIRNCIYGGALNNLLKELDQVSDWRQLNKMEDGNSYRFTKQEIILRMLALFDRSAGYQGNLAGFLNDYMQDFRNPDSAFIDEKRLLFTRTVSCIQHRVFNDDPPTLSLTVLEALLYGVAKNIDDLEQTTGNEPKERFDKMLSHAEFSESALREGLAKKPRVISRLTTAEHIFAGN